MFVLKSISPIETLSVLAPERLARIGSLGVVAAGLMAILVFLL